MQHATWQGADSPASPIHTARLILVSAIPAMIEADRDQHNFAGVTGLRIPESWPPEHWDAGALNWLLRKLAEYPDCAGWCRYVALPSQEGPTLVGTCGCVGPPEATDDVEIGYSILPPYQRRGYATEAVSALIEWIFHFHHVRSVNAQTFPDLAASLGVLRRCGFIAAGEGAEPGALRFWRART